MDPRVVALRSGSTREREDAWTGFYGEHGRWVYAMVCRSGVSGAEAEDITQRVFLTAFRKLEEGAEVRHLKAWLRGIVLKVVSRHHRWRRVRRVKAWMVREQERPVDGEAAVDAAAAQDLVARVLARLSPKLRDVLILTELEQCKPSEAAEILGIPVNTVRSRRRLATEAFQQQLQQLGYGEATP